jgi:hypothetical protein
MPDTLETEDTSDDQMSMERSSTPTGVPAETTSEVRDDDDTDNPSKSHDVDAADEVPDSQARPSLIGEELAKERKASAKETSESPPGTDNEADMDDSSRQWPEQELTENVSNLILKFAFGVELHDLSSGTSEAYDTVKQCLEDLSCLVEADRIVGSSPAAHEVPENRQPSSSPRSGQQIQSNTLGGQQAQRGLKRRSPSLDKNIDREDDDDGSDDDENPRQSGPASPKRTRLVGQTTRFCCPFRKRNPLRFNIRDHVTCATAFFADISSVK